VHCVVSELRRERQGRQIKAGPRPKTHRYPSEAADFCNKIGTKQTKPLP